MCHILAHEVFLHLTYWRAGGILTLSQYIFLHFCQYRTGFLLVGIPTLLSWYSSHWNGFSASRYSYTSHEVFTLKVYDYLMRNVWIPLGSIPKVLEYLLCSNACDFFKDGLECWSTVIVLTHASTYGWFKGVWPVGGTMLHSPAVGQKKRLGDYNVYVELVGEDLV
jgi:hypothetical protein